MVERHAGSFDDMRTYRQELGATVASVAHAFANVVPQVLRSHATWHHGRVEVDADPARWRLRTRSDAAPAMESRRG
jgi:hypothetical protein